MWDIFGAIWNVIVTVWFTFVSFFEQVLVLFALFTGSLALGIILFTICVRLAILPLTLKGIRSSRKMQDIQPLFKEIQRKYGKDQQRLQEETLKLYREHKINPVGGCFPLLLQLPIFLGVYQAIIHLMREDQHEFLGDAMRAAVVNGDPSLLLNQPLGIGRLWQMAGVENVSIIPELLQQSFLGINLGQSAFSGDFSEFSGFTYVILPIMAVSFQLIQQLMAMPRVQDPQQKMMAQMMLLMPLFFGYVVLTFPAGAVLYWVTTSIVGIIQQYFISGWGSLANYLKFLPPDKKSHRTTPAAMPDEKEQAGQSSALSPALAGASSSGSSGTVTERQTFWDVMRPLTELDIGSAAAPEGEADEPETAEQPHDHDKKQPDEKPRRQARPRSTNPRRQRRRR